MGQFSVEKSDPSGSDLNGNQQTAQATVCAKAAAQLAKAPAPELLRLWIALLLRLDPAAGVSALECQLDNLPPERNGSAVHWFAILFGLRDTVFAVDPRQPDFTPDLLLRLCRQAYRHVRPAEDLKREGVYTPDVRDDAERARGSLLSALVSHMGKDAWYAKLELVNDPLFAEMRDRVTFWAREKEAEAIDVAVHNESDVIDLLRYGETAPATRDEMFALLLDRLSDIEDLLLRDTSPREAWAGITKERVMRRELARALDGMANHAYSVDQEAVTAEEKETDIRLRSTASPQQATIELKLGERYSGAQLRTTLNDQLVTRYMAAETSRAGCLLVTVSTNKTWEHPDTGQLLDAAALAQMLELEADRIVGGMGGTLRLAAKVLDLRPRIR